MFLNDLLLKTIAYVLLFVTIKSVTSIPKQYDSWKIKLKFDFQVNNNTFLYNGLLPDHTYQVYVWLWHDPDVW